MLVLTRRVGERLIIGDNIAVIVSSVQGNLVKFGIKAPKNIQLHCENVRNNKKLGEKNFNR